MSYNNIVVIRHLEELFANQKLFKFGLGYFVPVQLYYIEGQRICVKPVSIDYDQLPNMIFKKKSYCLFVSVKYLLHDSVISVLCILFILCNVI